VHDHAQTSQNLTYDFLYINVSFLFYFRRSCCVHDHAQTSQNLTYDFLYINVSFLFYFIPLLLFFDW
jgi:hypothetical protein